MTSPLPPPPTPPTPPSPSPPASPSQADQPPSPTRPSSATALTEAHKNFTDLSNPLAYSGDSNKLMKQIHSFKYVYLIEWS